MFESISVAVKYKQLCNNMKHYVLLKIMTYGYMTLGSATAVQHSGLYIQGKSTDRIGLIVKEEIKVRFRLLGETRWEQDMSHNI